MLLLIIASLAWGSTPVLELGTQGYVPRGQSDLYAAGLNFGLGWGLGERVLLEGAVDYGYSLGRSDTPMHRLYLRPQLRYYATAPRRASPALSVVAGVGLGAIGALGDLGASSGLGVSMDLTSGSPVWLRATGGYALFTGDLGGGGFLALSVVRAPSEPRVEPPAPTTTQELWVSEPVCGWLESTEAQPILDALSSGESVELLDSYLAELELPEVAIEPPAEVAQGNLLLVAHPGDQVLIDNQSIPVTSEGSVVLTAPEGPLVVTVRGGGRSVERELLVFSGHVSWERIPAPTSQQIFFEVGSSAIDETSRQHLAAFFDDLGDYGVALEGSFSPEGSLGDNIQLARDRATSVGQLLVEFGLSSDRLRYIEPKEVPPDLSNEILRNVSLLPYALETGP